MILKFLVAAIVLAVLWMVMFRTTGRGRRGAPPPQRLAKPRQLV